MTSSPIYPSFNISSGATTSAELDLYATTLAGIIMPAAFTGATVTFLVSNASGGTFVDLYNSSGTQISLTVSASKAYGLNPTDFAGWRFVKLKSASAEGADRVILAATRHMQ